MSFPDKYFEQIKKCAYQNFLQDYPAIASPLLDEKPLRNAQVQVWNVPMQNHITNMKLKLSHLPNEPIKKASNIEVDRMFISKVNH